MRRKLMQFYTLDGKVVHVPETPVKALYKMMGSNIKSLSVTVMDSYVRFKYETSSGKGKMLLNTVEDR